MEGNKSNTFFCMDGCVNLNRIFRCVRPTGIFPRLPRRRMVEKNYSMIWKLMNRF